MLALCSSRHGTTCKEYVMKVVDDNCHERHQMLYTVKVLLVKKRDSTLAFSSLHTRCSLQSVYNPSVCFNPVSQPHTKQDKEKNKKGLQRLRKEAVERCPTVLKANSRIDATHLGRETLPIFVPEVRKFAQDNMKQIMEHYCHSAE